MEIVVNKKTKAKLAKIIAKHLSEFLSSTNLEFTNLTKTVDLVSSTLLDQLLANDQFVICIRSILDQRSEAAKE